MHLPDHYLDPLTCAATAVVSGGAIAYSMIRVRHEPATKVLAAAATGAAIFAAQMINFPVASGTSGHLVGGVLAGILLGPWAGLLVMTAVLSVQALVFGDGGVLALGANILNMGVIGVAIGALFQKAPGSAGGWISSEHSYGVKTWSGVLWLALAAWLSVVVAAFACALEMTMAGTATASEIVPAMLGVHALIGLAEAAITATTVVAVSYAARQSELWADSSRDGRYGLASAASAPRVAILLLPAIILVALAPLASSLPDGLSRVTDAIPSTIFPEQLDIPALLSDYAVPGIAWPPLATALAALLGVALVYSLTVVTILTCRRLQLRRTALVR